MANFGVPAGDARHTAALQWFADRAGQEIAWPEPFEGMFLVNKAKGIHKPKGLSYALSIRQSLSGPYEDALHWRPDGSWYLHYAYEGSDPQYFTNASLRACRNDGVPVGVVVQVKQKPTPRYKVLGLGLVTDERDGLFTINQLGTGTGRTDAAVAVAVPDASFDAANLEDARKREMRSIALRRGQPGFRKDLLSAYGRRCAFTGCEVESVLEAAHILPYKGSHTNHVQNGLLLRADVHTLFDLGLIGVDPERLVLVLNEALQATEYWNLNGRPLNLPANSSLWPSADALRQRKQLMDA